MRFLIKKKECQSIRSVIWLGCYRLSTGVHIQTGKHTRERARTRHAASFVTTTIEFLRMH